MGTADGTAGSVIPSPGAPPRSAEQSRAPASTRSPAPLPWPALLALLEERTRRLARVIESGEEVDVLDVALEADGPLPPELELRARTLLAETERLAARAERRKVAVDRELRYRQT